MPLMNARPRAFNNRGGGIHNQHCFAANWLRKLCHCLCLFTDGHGLVSQLCSRFGIKEGGHTLKFTAHPSHGLFYLSRSGTESPGETDQRRPTAKQRHYGTTVPLQLLGGDWRPVEQLKSQVSGRPLLKVSCLHICLTLLSLMPTYLSLQSFFSGLPRG